jgi:hypothetical protein
MLPGVMKPMTLEIISRPVYCKAKYPVQQNPRAIRPPVWYLHVNDANEGSRSDQKWRQVVRWVWGSTVPGKVNARTSSPA